MFDNGKIVILNHAEYDYIMSRHPVGDALKTIALDGLAREWFVEPLNPSEWADQPDVLEYIALRAVEVAQ